jgi:hypothetical protein
MPSTTKNDDAPTFHAVLPSDYSVWAVRLKETSRPELVRAMYYTIQDSGWVCFKDHHHKVVRDYSPNAVHTIARSKAPGDGFAFNAATPVEQIVSDLVMVRSEDDLAKLANRIDSHLHEVRVQRERTDHLRAVAALHPDWSVEQVHHAVASGKSAGVVPDAQ